MFFLNLFVIECISFAQDVNIWIDSGTILLFVKNDSDSPDQPFQVFL
jgi:hypothetical protein